MPKGEGLPNGDALPNGELLNPIDGGGPSLEGLDSPMFMLDDPAPPPPRGAAPPKGAEKMGPLDSAEPVGTVARRGPPDPPNGESLGPVSENGENTDELGSLSMPAAFAKARAPGGPRRAPLDWVDVELSER